ncbi:type I toxin-antitoxin system SymE family toxin [Ralstonia solanacearum]|nr:MULTISPECIES: type I toxin-antitoxin system SymE family toxin [Ralstonia solanacearum species complex]MDB0507898.1 type I toxin-antitoxin system SymE family toxin [Ralstonia solanacearum]MDB0512167.1 type I toxin-antitoxin system SymE family toxin [Ralstonia solanacearum]MDB0526657.1 type I toxin-antitoxin system SymE family toxin [Ralstonia solanacearum]MDB0542721.1 type I toxin-antitoxin system SymE family toxin [Ralstonia solanacearum]MDB0553002.1 type I toxin-antitoxin system SymE famil
MQFLSHTPVLLAVMIGVTRQAGFTPDQRVHAVVEHGRMIITAD